MSIRGRKAQLSDVPDIRRLMISLAEFEHYVDQFNVSASDVQDIIRHSNTIHFFVADSGEDRCVALAILFQQPFTYDMKPWFILKEFIVDDRYRGQGIGRILFEHIIAFARRERATKIKWEVLCNNSRAKEFYEGFGSEHQLEWQIYQIEIEASK